MDRDLAPIIVLVLVPLLLSGAGLVNPVCPRCSAPASVCGKVLTAPMLWVNCRSCGALLYDPWWSLPLLGVELGGLSVVALANEPALFVGGVLLFATAAHLKLRFVPTIARDPPVPRCLRHLLSGPVWECEWCQEAGFQEWQPPLQPLPPRGMHPAGAHWS